jgi:hypothetical protein
MMKNPATKFRGGVFPCPQIGQMGGRLGLSDTDLNALSDNFMALSDKIPPRYPTLSHFGPNLVERAEMKTSVSP